MAKKKYDLITDLYAEAVKQVTASPENWMSFLRSACRGSLFFHKISSVEQTVRLVNAL